MREQVITPRGGRGAAAGRGAKGGASASQRPAARRPRAAAKPSRSKGLDWKRVLAFAPLALKLVLAVSFGALAFVGYRTAASASFFKVRSVDVVGAERASREEIRQAVLRHSSDEGVWRADLEAIGRDVRALPWVRTAVVTRVLPDGLRVRVAERTGVVIARTSGGKLAWFDEEGVMLGPASPGEPHFFVRGLEESRSEEARRHNRERVAVALDLSRAWEREGLARRVSEVNLADLNDVRVHLAGDDARIQVILGGEDYARRFRQALEKLEEVGRAQSDGQCVTYILMTRGRSATFGRRPCAEVNAAAQQPAAQAAAEGGATGDTAAPSSTEPARGAVQRAEKKPEKKSKPREGTEQKPRQDVASRPRRVG